MLGELHQVGVSKEQILDTFSQCRLSGLVVLFSTHVTEPAVACLQYLQQKDCFVAIASDSNTVYIDTVLQVCRIWRFCTD